MSWDNSGKLVLTESTSNTPMFQVFQELPSFGYGNVHSRLEILLRQRSHPVGFWVCFSPSPSISHSLSLVSIHSSVCSSLPLWTESMSVFISTRLLSGCRWDLLWDFLHAFVCAYKKPLLSECFQLPLVLKCFIEWLWIIESSSERSVSCSLLRRKEVTGGFLH